MTNTFFLANSDMNDLLYRKSANEAEKLVQSLNKALDKVSQCFSQRFVMTEQDIWYDFVTGLILPKFENNRPVSYNIDDIITNDHKIRQIEFCGFNGRLMTEQEARTLLDPEAAYPYRHASINKFDIMVGWITFNSQKTTRVVTKVCKAGPLLLTREFNCEQGFIPVYDSTKRKLINAQKGFSTHAVVIPVYNLTAAHPLGRSLSNEERMKEYKTTANSFIEHGLWPIGLSDAVKKELQTTWSAIYKYVEFDDKLGSYRLNQEQFQRAWKEYQSKPQENEPLGKIMFKEADVGNKILVDTSLVKELLLNSDHVRANLSPYPENILTDLNSGHWELYEQILEPPAGMTQIDLPTKLPARPAALDVCEDGICAIDFGTKSTTVVCRNNGEHLRRIGRGDLSKAPRIEDYENPTVIELRDIKSFLKSYRERDGRPFTKWEQATVSHAARNRLLENEGRNIFQSVFSELKQWARLANSGCYRMRDQKGHEVVLPSYTEIVEGDFDPIELYAYYLGLYINNMHHDGGIYLEYILSYPVKYPQPVRDCIQKSFERGIKKSLPPSILHDEELMQDFSVEIGASEPAAYAACALKELGKMDADMQPTKKKHICYGVFDFGGGTTDFDYGIWRLPNEQDGGSWNYVIEHFGAGSDEDLGGENLLNLIAYQVFQDNLEEMRKNNIHFALPNGCKPFMGGELLIDDSDAAYLNRRRLSEKLRPVWEQTEEPSDEGEDLGSDKQSMVFFKDNETVSVSLNIDKPKLQAMLKARIKRGVNNFFVKLWDSFRGRNISDRIDILLAGNSCKSPIVKALFEERIAKEEEAIKNGVKKDTAQAKDAKGVFRLHMPLGMVKNDEGSEVFDRSPTGKTGVAFGLLACYRGDHNIKVMDYNRSDNAEVPFRYYLGRRKGDNFEVTIGMDLGYGVWAPFMELEREDKTFSLYYTSEPQALLVDAPMAISQVKYRKCRVRYNDNVLDSKVFTVYIRKIGPTKIEYVAALPTGIEQGEFLTEAAVCELA